jgi:para-nitrobenzyl esterase
MNTIATTTKGRVEGREKEGVALFAGIPYVAPVVGELRFQAPRPHDAWEGVRPAQRFGPAAPQIPGEGLTSAGPVRWDEDCLTLNVSTPAADDGRRPVLVWIHGGGYRTGQGGIPWYNGARFAANGDIVVVSINYRLGALGFTHLARFGDEYATSGVNGTMDQVAALEWVRDNIEAFGGDPENVTIAGESAGGFSIGTLLAVPKAEGLFRRAIAQSGAAHHTLPLEAGEKVADLFCDELGVNSVDDLHTASAEEILNVQGKVDVALGIGGGLTNSLGLTVAPFFEALQQGASAGIPVLTGTNRDETTLWGYGEVDEERLGRRATRVGGNEQIIETYRSARSDASPADILIAITTDHMFRIPAIRLAEARAANGGNTWMYLFAWESRAFGGRLRATHALEIPFTFDNLDKGGVDALLGEGPTPQKIADVMHAAWTSFIRTGDPNCDALPDWPAYDTERRATMVFNDTERRATMVFNDTSETVDDPSGAERRVWDGLR